MNKKYRIKQRLNEEYRSVEFAVQVRTWCGAWIDVKVFHDPEDCHYAYLEAEDLMDKLTE